MLSINYWISNPLCKSLLTKWDGDIAQSMSSHSRQRWCCIKQKAASMITLIKNTAFWYALAHMKTHLEPLAIATNFAQATFYCLDQILLTFRSLIAYYLKLPDVSDPGVQAIIASIEKQWDKADQEIFIAAVILNPFIKITPFNTSVSLFMNMGIFNLMKYLYTHFSRFLSPQLNLPLIVQPCWMMYALIYMENISLRGWMAIANLLRIRQRKKDSLQIQYKSTLIYPIPTQKSCFHPCIRSCLLFVPIWLPVSACSACLEIHSPSYGVDWITRLLPPLQNSRCISVMNTYKMNKWNLG